MLLTKEYVSDLFLLHFFWCAEVWCCWTALRVSGWSTARLPSLQSDKRDITNTLAAAPLMDRITCASPSRWRASTPSVNATKRQRKELAHQKDFFSFSNAIPYEPSTGEQLQINQPNVYDCDVPQSFATAAPALAAVCKKGSTRVPATNRSVTLTSKGGSAFVSFAKGAAFNDGNAKAHF